MRLHRRLPRHRHRHGQAVTSRSRRHPASPHRRRRADGGLLSGALRRRTRRSAIRDISARGRVPILVGGTGFYYRALVRGLFPGPARDDAASRAARPRRRPAAASKRSTAGSARVDPDSALRIQPRDRKRLVRALEVYLLTGQPLTVTFRGHGVVRSPGFASLPLGLVLPRPELARARRTTRRRAVRPRCRRRSRALLASGVPESAHAFSGLVYRQIIELLRGVRARGRDPRAHRPGEHALRTAPADLVSQGSRT